MPYKQSLLVYIVDEQQHTFQHASSANLFHSLIINSHVFFLTFVSGYRVIQVVRIQVFPATGLILTFLLMQNHIFCTELSEIYCETDLTKHLFSPNVPSRAGVSRMRLFGAATVASWSFSKI